MFISERLKPPVEVTQRVSGRAGIQLRADCFQSSCPFHSPELPFGTYDLALTFLFVRTLKVDTFEDPVQGPRYPASEALRGRNFAEQIGTVDFSFFLCTFWQQLKQLRPNTDLPHV